MSAYKNILFPFDSSLQTEEPFWYAIDLAKNNGGTLIFLYTHRLDANPERKLISASDLRSEMKISADDQLDRIRAKFGLDGKIDYEFHPEIGFLESRIILKLKEYPIDLLLLVESMVEQLEMDTERIECPIMMIPH